jgi:hypothetical protein
VGIAVCAVAEGAGSAVFDAFFGDAVISATVFAQCVEGTIAKQAVELLPLRHLVAWIIFTFFV